MTKEQLAALIKDMVGGDVKSELDKSLAPILEQQTSWMKDIQQMRDKVYNGREQTEVQKGIGAARFVRAMAFAKGDPGKAASFAEKSWNDALGKEVHKSLLAGDLTAGGVLVPPAFAAEIIELLRARSVVRAAGSRTLNMNNGTLTLRKQTGGSTATYVGESTDITKTQPTTGQIVMTAKKLAALVPISNDLLTFDAGDQTDAFVRDDLVQQIATREDQAFLRDDGTSDTPKGLRYWVSSSQVESQAGTTSANIESDLALLINDLELSNVPLTKPVWLMSPRSRNHLRTLRDATGFLIFPEIRTNTPTLYGYPVFLTTNIPTNLGGGGNETEVYMVDMNEAIIGEASTLEIAVDSSASYIDNGTLVSAFSRDETLMRAITRHDFAVRHPEAIAVLQSVTWGA